MPSFDGLSKNETETKKLRFGDTFGLESHLTDNTKKLLTECNTDIAVIPGELTSLVQPLDVRINKPFKQSLKRQWNTHELCLDGTKDDCLFMEESNSDGENDTDFDDVPEDITEDEYADLFMLSNNESS
ncbi:hypothetical protein TNCV_731621 [Trichonephila clavipes]|nr:hypothetical protein TNCV_731621 [Trichonephila clavipes]